MSKQTRVIHPIYSLLPTEVEGFGHLAELAWICAGRGIMQLTKCGCNLIPRCGNSRITLGGSADGFAGPA